MARENEDIRLDVLAFGAHPDDVELSVAGTLIKLIKQGYAVGVADMTRGESGTRGTMEIRQKEAAEAARFMGIKVRECLDIPDGNVTVTRENQLKVIRLLRKYQPRILFTHYWQAPHPDHVASSHLVTDACYLSGLIKIDTGQERHRPKRILYHQLPYNVIPSLLVDVSAEVEQKWKVIHAHRSQFYDPNSKEPETRLSATTFLEMIDSRMRYWGSLLNVSHAEPFFTTEPVTIPDLVAALG